MSASRPDVLLVPTQIDDQPAFLTYIGPASSTARHLSLYQPHRETMRNYRVGEVRRLEASTHTLTLRYEGAGEGGGKELGIDFIWVQKRPDA